VKPIDNDRAAVGIRSEAPSFRIGNAVGHQITRSPQRLSPKDLPIFVQFDAQNYNSLSVFEAGSQRIPHVFEVYDRGLFAPTFFTVLRFSQ
jgi:hypothetical protein